jgi:hypothetical protein
MEKGTSQDGNNIQAYMQLVYASESTHRVLKRYRKASLEISGSDYCSFSVSYNLAYGSNLVGQPSSANYSVPFTEAFWDSMVWDDFTWDGTSLTPSEIEVRGTGENIALYITSNSNVLQPFTVNTATLHYTVRRGLR